MSDFKERVLQLCKQAEAFPGPPGGSVKWLIEQIRALEQTDEVE